MLLLIRIHNLFKKLSLGNILYKKRKLYMCVCVCVRMCALNNRVIKFCHLPFTWIVAFASRAAGRFRFEAVLTNLGAELWAARFRKRTTLDYRFAGDILGGTHRTKYLRTVIIHAPTNQTVPRALLGSVITVYRILLIISSITSRLSIIYRAH